MRPWIYKSDVHSMSCFTTIDSVSNPFAMSGSALMSMRLRKELKYFIFFSFLVPSVCMTSPVEAQESDRMVRVARIRVDPVRLVEYRLALKEQMSTAVRLEPGVLSYQAVADRKDPSRITILEVYENRAAYESHVATPHFKKYKDAVKEMVLELELVDVDELASYRREVHRSFDSN